MDIFYNDGMDKLLKMRHAGRVNIEAIEHGFEIAKPGISLLEIDKAMEQYILKAGCNPAFKGYRPEGAPSPFPNTACLSPNEVAVHGIPSAYVLKPGDLLTIDVGTEYQGYFVDSARTRIIPGKKNQKAQQLINATEDILKAQLAVVKDGCTLLSMVYAAETMARHYNVNIMPQWGGHGISNKIHQGPFIPSAIDRTQSKIKQDIEERRYSRQFLQEGQTVCIEPVVTYGSQAITLDNDKWTVRQAEKQLTAHTERCLLVTKDGYKLLS